MAPLHHGDPVHRFNRAFARRADQLGPGNYRFRMAAIVHIRVALPYSTSVHNCLDRRIWGNNIKILPQLAIPVSGDKPVPDYPDACLRAHVPERPNWQCLKGRVANTDGSSPSCITVLSNRRRQSASLPGDPKWSFKAPTSPPRVSLIASGASNATSRAPLQMG